MKLDEIKVASIDDVEARLTEIRSLDIDNLEDVKAIDQEVDALNERRKALKDEVDAKKELRNKILTGEVKTQEIEKPKETRTMELNKDNYLSTKEYRSAFLKNLMGKELNTEERTALALSGADPIVPQEMQQDILTKVKDYAPILNDITLLNVNGAVKFAVEGTNNGATVHTENGTIEASSDTLVEVVLSTYEIVKMIQISASVKSMSIASFEAWLVQMLVEAIGIKVENLVFNGTGSAQAQGVNALTWDATNSITVAKASTTTSANVYALFGLCKERNVKIYMNRKTLFGDFMPLMDNAKNHLVKELGGIYYVLGAKVEITDAMADGEAILGNFKKYVGNLAEAINVKTDYDINTNSHKYLGVANFDGKVAVKEAFAKLVKATA